MEFLCNRDDGVEVKSVGYTHEVKSVRSSKRSRRRCYRELRREGKIRVFVTRLSLDRLDIVHLIIGRLTQGWTEVRERKN